MSRLWSDPEDFTDKKPAYWCSNCNTYYTEVSSHICVVNPVKRIELELLENILKELKDIKDILNGRR